MDEPLEEMYFNWLYTQVASVEFPTPSNTFLTLFRDLHAVEFVWLVSGDDNRAEDGLEVRKDFLRQARLDQDPPWLSIGCSFLEMLIAFSRRAAFDVDFRSPREWFWQFLDNLELADLCDARSGVSRKVSTTLDRVIFRTYRNDGRGGLFPLERPNHDQRKVEIWYQFCEWLVDQEIF